MKQELDGLQKAAILLIALGPEKASSIFKHLKEEETEALTLEIANTRSISPGDKDEIVNEFYQICLAQQYIVEGGIADDQVFDTIDLYFTGLYTREQALDQLQYKKPNHQVCITNQSLIDNYLQFLYSEKL